MKTFIYQIEEGKPARNGSGTKRTVTIWRVKNNKPIFLKVHTEAFCYGFQLVMEALKNEKVLPKKAFDRNETGAYTYGTQEKMKQAGFAIFHEI